MNLSNEYFKRVFGLTDEVAELEHRLIDGFEELSFLFLSDDVLSWLRRNHSLTEGALRIAVDPEPPLDIKGRRADVIFHFGNYLASAQAAIDFLYNFGKNGRFTAALLNRVTERTDKLKKCKSQKLLTALRNRMVHAPPLLDKVSIHMRTRNHPDGAGGHLCAVLTDRSIRAIDSNLPAEEIVQALWEKVKRQNSQGQDWLTPILVEHGGEFETAFSNAKALVQQEYAESFAEYSGLENRRQELEAELSKLGAPKLDL